MIIIPAIDIKNGKCVRLLQGRMDAETVFSDDPAAMGNRWESEGAELIHVVDLDGAVGKRPVNLDTIRLIIDRVNVPQKPRQDRFRSAAAFVILKPSGCIWNRAFPGSLSARKQ